MSDRLTEVLGMISFPEIVPEPARRKVSTVKAVESRYRLTPGQWEKMYAAQGGCCAICDVAFGDTTVTTPHVDHCHETGKVRGLLCRQCNLGLGGFRDNPKSLKRAIKYLQGK